VTAGMAIFDTMKHIRPDVSTVCIGLAARYETYISVERSVIDSNLRAIILIFMFDYSSLGFSSCVDPNVILYPFFCVIFPKIREAHLAFLCL